MSYLYLQEVRALVSGAIAFFVTQGFKLLSEWMKKDLHGWAAFVTFVVTAGVLASFDALISLIPDDYRDVLGEVLAWILKASVVLLGGSGIFRVYKSIKK